MVNHLVDKNFDWCKCEILARVNDQQSASNTGWLYPHTYTCMFVYIYIYINTSTHELGVTGRGFQTENEFNGKNIG